MAWRDCFIFGQTLALVFTLLATPANVNALPTVLLSDDFNSENGGFGLLNYSGFVNWNVTDGSVDLSDRNSFGLTPLADLVVDLDGTTNNAGRLESKTIFTLDSGTYELRFDLAGNQRPSFPPTDTVTVSLGDVFSEDFTLSTFDPLTTIVRNIVVVTPTTGTLVFDHAGGDNVGLLLDNVQLTQLTATIDNLCNVGSISAFGEQFIPYFAQSFIALPGRLQELTFRIATGPEDNLDFRVLITETTGGTGEGIHPSTVLFESNDIILPPNTPFTDVSFDIGGLELVPGVTYAFVLDAFVLTTGDRGNGTFGNCPFYPDGHAFFFRATFGTRADHFNLIWESFLNADIPFRLTFGDETPSIEVPLDIKPQSCPNPLNVKAKGVLPVAILGTAEFDVTQVDVTTVQLQGVSPLRDAFEDVATPFAPLNDNTNDLDCTDAGPDGFMDFTLKFDAQATIEAIEASLGRQLTDDEALILTLTGELFDGTPIQGEDVVVILKKGN